MPMLADSERRAMAVTQVTVASTKRVERLARQYAELMTVLNEKMVAWDGTLRRLEATSAARTG